MVRPYQRGRRRYLLIRWDPSSTHIGRGALIALVRERLNRVTRELVRTDGEVHARSGLARYDPPWAVVVVDHRLQDRARELLNTRWRGTDLATVAASGTIRALWRRTGRPTPPRRQ